MPPKGWRKNGVTPAEEVVKGQEVVEPVEEVKAEPESKSVEMAKELSAELTPIQVSRKSLEQVLAEGQAFFEAPDGYIVVGDSTADRVFYRAGNNGRGIWINRRRV